MNEPEEYPVELDPVDIEPYRSGNTGVPYYTTFDSGRAGPHVLINALVHGNELCGAMTVDALFRANVRPLRGRLTLGLANVEAYRRFDRTDPAASRFVDEDLNRVWDEASLGGPRRSCELERARTLRPLIDTVDLLLDLHSMQHRTPPLLLCGPLDKGRALARAVGFPAYVVSDAGHSAGRRLRDYGAFGDPSSPGNALLVECGQHWEAGSPRIAMESTLRFLLHCGLIDEDTAPPRLGSPLEPQQFIEVTDAVTVRTDDFSFSRPFIGMERLATAGTVIGCDGGAEIVTPYDDCILIMPTRRFTKGQTAVRLGRVVA